MFLAANIQWNHKHDANSAVAVWNRLVREYPASEEADASTLFISVVYRWTNQPDAARKVLTDFLATHPDSPLAEGARKQLTILDSMPSAGVDRVHPQSGRGKSDRQQQSQP
jgi:TolA-binding protein